MTRISRHDLDVQLRNLNRDLGRPEEPYSHDADGKYQPNAGNLHLSGAYGGWQVQEMMASSGVRSLTSGYEPLRSVSTFLDGMSAALTALLPRDEYGRVSTWDVTYTAVPKEPVKLPGRNPCDTDGPDGTCAQCIVTDRLTAEREADA